jgi:hypothetical protein
MRLFFCSLCVLYASVVHCLAINREAFTFTKYDLSVRIEPEQQRLGVRGTITLRNDSPVPQKIAVLQISSSLSWRSIKAGGRQLQFVGQNYTSDIDHTGALSEAVVTLPDAIAPKATIDLEIAYEGVILLDATRLTSIGTPEAAAKNNDWDQISTKFTAVRGAGNVAWYPVAAEAADLAEATSLSDVLDRWRLREAAASAHLQLAIQIDSEDLKPELLLNAKNCTRAGESNHEFIADCTYQSVGMNPPAFVMADFEAINRLSAGVHYFAGHDSSAVTYADAADKALPLITEWFGALRGKPQVADLPDSDAAPSESGSLLLMPLTDTDAKRAGIVAAHQLTHAAFFSPRTWINEGLAHFAQALYLEQLSGRQAALDYMAAHRFAINASESRTLSTERAEHSLESRPETGANPRPEGEANGSLINTTDEELLRSKAMCVWWMLREMVGDAALKKAIAAYRPEQDTEPSYMQGLIQAQAQKDLEWFFDDWVYRDRGLPDFKVESAFVRKTLPEGFMVTVTVANSGTAAAEIPVTVKFTGGEVTQRMVVRGKGNAVVRVTTLKTPEEVVVNDGSVPESDTTNNVLRIQSSDIRESGASSQP